MLLVLLKEQEIRQMNILQFSATAIKHSTEKKPVEIENESENSNDIANNESEKEDEKERSENNEESLKNEKERQDRKRKYGLMRLPTATTSLKNQPAVTPKIFSENGAN
jgi:hypothetical protein